MKTLVHQHTVRLTNYCVLAIVGIKPRHYVDYDSFLVVINARYYKVNFGA